MTHMPGIPVRFDPPSEPKKCHEDWRCRKCGGASGVYRTHTSSCGSWDDDEFECLTCGHTYWVEGPDA